MPLPSRVARIVSSDRRPPTRPIIRRLSADDVAVLKDVIRGRVVPPGPFDVGRAINAVALREPSPDVSRLLAAFLADDRQPAVDRAVAAASLPLLPQPESQAGLIASLHVPDPQVRLRVIRSLGAVGDADALAALERMPTPGSEAEQRQLAFSKSVIAHRLGRPSDHLPAVSGVERQARSKRDLITLTLRPMMGRTIAAERRAFRGPDYGMRASERVGFALRAGEARWTVFVNAEIAGLAGFSRMFERPWIIALLARWDERTEGSAVQYVVLTDPATGGAAITVVRPDGEIFYSGHAARRAGGLFSFSVSDVDRPGTAPTTVKGHLTLRGLELDAVVPFGRRRNQSQGEDVRPPA
jgi:hypothetical protein